MREAVWGEQGWRRWKTAFWCFSLFVSPRCHLTSPTESGAKLSPAIIKAKPAAAAATRFAIFVSLRYNFKTVHVPAFIHRVVTPSGCRCKHKCASSTDLIRIIKTTSPAYKLQAPDGETLSQTKVFSLHLVFLMSLYCWLQYRKMSDAPPICSLALYPYKSYTYCTGCERGEGQLSPDHSSQHQPGAVRFSTGRPATSWPSDSTQSICHHCQNRLSKYRAKLMNSCLAWGGVSAENGLLFDKFDGLMET